MRTLGTAFLAAAILVVSFGPAGARASGSAGQAVAITRCDSKNINDYQDRVQDWDRHPARGTQDELKRLADLQDVVNGLAQERGVLDAVCPENQSRAPFNSQIAAVQAWAYALEADVAIALGPPCPSAGNAIPQQLLANAWFALAGNITENGATVTSVAQVVPKVQSRAAKINFTLPAVAETSNYWVTQTADATKAAIAACNLPSATPSPTPTPVETPGG
jgi:hypothetical protein